MLGDKPERYESDFTYQPLMRKPNMKSYISPEFQSELREVTESYLFKQKLPNGYVKSEDGSMPQVKMNRNQKAHSSIVSDQTEARPDTGSKAVGDPNGSTPVSKRQT